MPAELCLICGGEEKGYLLLMHQFKCTICGESIAWDNVVSHYMKHVKISGNDAICGVCNAKVKRAEIRDHIRSHFVIRRDRRFFCGVCGREFLNVKSLLVHIRRGHE